jgi:tetratricopeptide (TPR) repeat protein
MFWIRLRRAGKCIRLRRLSLIVGIAAGLLVMLVPFHGLASPITSDLNQPQSFFRAGIIALEQANYKEAIAQFTQTLQTDSQFTAAFSNRCLAHLQQGDYGRAVQDCTQALRLDANNPEAYLNRGLAHDRMGQFERAIADYNQLLQRRPDDFRAYYNRGLAQFELGAYRKAIADYERSLHQPGLTQNVLAEIYSDRGLAKLVLTDQDGAIADFSEAIQLDHANTRAYYNRACAYHRQGNLLLAIDDLTQVLTQAPDHAEAHRSRGLIRYQLGEKWQAIADLQQAAQHFSNQGEAIAYQQTLNLIHQIEAVSFAVG